MDLSYSYSRVITIEDVLETLLQEQIYDENDIIERKAGKRIAKFLSKQWKGKSNLDMGDVVQQAMENYDQEAGEGAEMMSIDVCQSLFDGQQEVIDQLLIRN